MIGIGTVRGRMLRLNRYVNWLRANQDGRLAILEFGAGSAVPTVRYECEKRRPTLIRINPREAAKLPTRGAIGIQSGALNAINEIDRLLGQRNENSEVRFCERNPVA